MSGTEQGQEIAVAVDDSGVITHFGKARAFHVYTTQGDAKREDTAEVAKVLPITETVCTRHSMGFEEETKPERLARALDLIGGYGTLIVGAIGPPARAGLEEKGIRVLIAGTGDPATAVRCLRLTGGLS